VSPKTSQRNRLPPLTPAQQRAAFDKAVAQFNSWRFYDCHETLEDVWRAEPEPIADFFQGVIKVAAGLHHLLRGNRKGALNLLTHALALLQPYEPATFGIDVRRLRADTAAVLERVRALGPKQLDQLDRSSLPRIHPEASA
jgi:predicted metal-dependent hydrolase